MRSAVRDDQGALFILPAEACDEEACLAVHALGD